MLSLSSYLWCSRTMLLNVSKRMCAISGHPSIAAYGHDLVEVECIPDTQARVGILSLWTEGVTYRRPRFFRCSRNTLMSSTRRRAFLKLLQNYLKSPLLIQEFFSTNAWSNIIYLSLCIATQYASYIHLYGSHDKCHSLTVEKIQKAFTRRTSRKVI